MHSMSRVDVIHINGFTPLRNLPRKLRYSLFFLVLSVRCVSNDQFPIIELR
jgi:hypothetical protein